jgi:hypothetical protein
MGCMRDIDLDKDVVWLPGGGQMIRAMWFDSPDRPEDGGPSPGSRPHGHLP